MLQLNLIGHKQNVRASKMWQPLREQKTESTSVDAIHQTKWCISEINIGAWLSFFAVALFFEWIWRVSRILFCLEIGERCKWR